MKTQKRISQLAYKKNRPKQVGGYLYVPQFSSPTLAVYRNRRGKIIVGIRGTKLTSADDLKADWKILRGKNLKGTARYKEAELLIRKLMRDYGEENVELTGHSLGGTIAAQIHDEYLPTSKIHVFKPGVGVGGTLTTNENVHAEKAPLDPVNMFGNTGPNTTLENGYLRTGFNLVKSTINPFGGLLPGMINPWGVGLLTGLGTNHSSEH
eukprot:CFRG2540T1